MAENISNNLLKLDTTNIDPDNQTPIFSCH